MGRERIGEKLEFGAKHRRQGGRRKDLKRKGKEKYKRAREGKGRGENRGNKRKNGC